MAKQNKTRYSLLGLLSFGPMTGYEMKKLIDRSIYYFWTDSYGHIYPLLKKMEKEGLVVSRGEITGGHQKNRFSITEKGRRELKAWLRNPVEPESVRSEFLLKVFFGNQISRKEVGDMVVGEKAKHLELLRRYDEIEKEFAGVRHESKQFWLCTLNYGKRLSKATLAWCDETTKELSRKSGK